MKKILFLHGLESKPGGSKANMLTHRGYKVLNPHLPKNSWEDSLEVTQETIDIEMPDIIVGSSRGGAVALNVNPRGAKLVLIAPAWKRFGADPQHCDGSTVILHCADDDLVDYKDSEELASKTGANLIPCGKSHRMDDSDALDAIIDAVNWCSKR
jgi:predicted alpha/beta hydrolase family esterase